MAIGSGAGSSSTASARSRGVREAQPLCPFYKTLTVVEQTSRTQNNPLKQFYTCTNRDWGNDRCSFFMWKPASAEDAMEAAALMVGMKEMETTL